MQYRKYGKTGHEISLLGFGAMRLPMKDNHVDMDLSVKLMRRAVELGVNYIDTAVMYCNHESQIAVGKAVKGIRDKVYVSTKNHYRGESPDEWQKYLDESLRLMELDYIDFYHLHGLSWDAYQQMSGKGKPIERMHKVHEEGLIKHMCFSSHDSPENIIKLIDTGEFEGMLVQYNLLDRRNEEAIAHAHESGMGVVIMGPVGGGRLVADSPQIRKLIPGGAKSTPEVALRFVISNPNVTSAISGMNTMEMVEENVATAAYGGPLSEEEHKRVLEMLEENKRMAELYCTACGYCMPCPNGVDIPANFGAMNYHRVYGLTEYAKNQYRRLGRRRKKDGTTYEAWAAACVECGECEPKCPQNIPIIKQLKETHETLGSD